MIDALSLQAKLDAREPIESGPGDLWIDRPLRIEPRFGVTWRGAGACPDDPQRPGCRTLVRWAGPPGVPMVECYGAHITLDGVGFDCNFKATAGLQFKKDATADNYASGKLDCRSLYVHGATEAGIICGERETDHHCDTIGVDRYWCWKSKRALLVNDAQSMDHDFGRVDLFGTQIGFEYNAGGCLDVRKVFATFGPTTILKLNGGLGYGRDNAAWKVGFVKGDFQAAVMLLDQTGYVFDAMVAFEFGRLAKPAAELIRTEGPIQVDVRNVWRIPKRSISMRRLEWIDDQKYDGAPQVRLDHCRVMSTNQADSFTRDYAGQAIGRDCTFGQRQRLGDWTPKERN